MNQTQGSSGSRLGSPVGTSPGIFGANISMPVQKLRIIELAFCKDGIKWTKTIETYQVWQPSYPGIDMTTGVKTWVEWATINGTTEIFYYHPEYLMEATIIEES